MEKCCYLLNSRHSVRISILPGANGLVEVQYKNLGTNLRLILHDSPENCSIQIYFIAHAHNTQPSLHLHIATKEILFHTQPRFALTFLSNLSPNSLPGCTAQYCSDLFSHSHYQSFDIKPLFQNIKLKPISTWFLALET